MAVVAHPQRLTALLARLFQWGQRDRMRRFRTRGSGSSDHGLSPAELFILLPPSGYTCCQALFSVQGFLLTGILALRPAPFEVIQRTFHAHLMRSLPFNVFFLPML